MNGIKALAAPTGLICGAVLLCSAPCAAQDGAKVYQKTCSTCHDTGQNNAPRLSDQQEWRERAKAGVKNLVETVITGIQGYSGEMPPRGGDPNLSDAQIEAAVRYMLRQVGVEAAGNPS